MVELGYHVWKDKKRAGEGLNDEYVVMTEIVPVWMTVHQLTKESYTVFVIAPVHAL